MGYWIGVYLLVTGVLSLVFNEFTVRVRRVWPWRRHDTDPVRDAELNEFYRFTVYLWSVISIEIGAGLAAIGLPHGAIRLAVYLGCLALLLWRRPAMRELAFWLALPYRGKRPRVGARLSG